MFYYIYSKAYLIYVQCLQTYITDLLVSIWNSEHVESISGVWVKLAQLSWLVWTVLLTVIFGVDTVWVRLLTNCVS